MDAAPAADGVTLGFGFDFADLAAREGLIRLDRPFLDRLAARMPRCTRACSRHAPRRTGRWREDESDLVVALGPHLDAFVATLFGIEAETLALARETQRARPDPRLQAAVRAAPGGEEIPRSVRLRRRRRCAPRWKRGSARR